MWFYKSDPLQNPVTKTYTKSGRGILKNCLYLLKTYSCSFPLVTNESLLYCFSFPGITDFGGWGGADSRKFTSVMCVCVVETYSFVVCSDEIKGLY